MSARMTWMLGIVALLCGLVAAPGAAPAQDWPTRPVRVVVSFGPGGTADILGRLIAAELTKQFNQQFYIDNRAGAGGALGSAEVARAEPNGYTLLIAGAGPQLVGPPLNANISYDTMRDFTHIAMIAGDGYMLAVNPAMGVHNLAEFLAATRDLPGVTCGSPGANTQGELLQAIINKKVGTKLSPVSFRSAADAISALLGNQIQSAMQPSISLGEFVRSNTLVALAVTTSERLSAYKDIPTLKELGYDVEGGASWFWLAGPSKLPPEIIAKLNGATRKALEAPNVRELFARNALSSQSLNPVETTAFIASEVKLWASVVKETGAKAQ
jgi:tripartite-type tricarboxylate transporter receptor subunit TctC